MDWTRALNVYCERTDPSYWSEPVNALSNLGFIVAAYIMWRRSDGDRPARALCILLFLIGVGSWLWHTHALAWAGALDVLPVVLFTLMYIYLANRHMMNWPPVVSALGSAAYVPYSFGLATVFGMLPFFSVSAGYWPLPVLIFAYAYALRRRVASTSRNLAIGAAILCISLVFRSVDGALCQAIPFGTHFVWHLLNAVMLGWMIETWLRHRTIAV